MKEKKPTTVKRKAKAAEYYKLALHAENQKDYTIACQYYQKSLKLYDDKEVRKAYLKLLSIIGPM